jgi:S-adenosylmethionine synthetase
MIEENTDDNLHDFAQLLFTSESVTEGHPDKMCDQISDAVLDAHAEQDPMAARGVRDGVKTGYVMLPGRNHDHAFVNFDDLVRSVVNDIGFDDGSARASTATPAACRLPLPRKAPTLPGR